MVLKPLPDDKVHIKPCFPHVVAVQKQRKFKDLFLVKDIFDHVRERSSVFEMFFYKESLFAFERNIRNVFANCWLDDSYLPSFCKYERISSIEQVDGLRDGILYLHDIESMFNSRGSLSDRDMNDLVNMVNNAGKHRLQIRASAHRDMSVDVKLRSLINLWIEPEPYFFDDYWYLNNYIVVLSVFDSDKIKIGNFVVEDLHRYANLYDTEEEARKLPRFIEVKKG